LTKIPTPAVILDLDDTLYLERDYVRSGFDAVGRHVAEKCGRKDFGSRCWALFEQGVRGTTFDQVLRDTRLNECIETAELVEVYRNHAPSIRLADDVTAFLDSWPKHRPLGLITDGPVASQGAKIEALQLHHRLHPIILSDSFGSEYRKPHDKPFEEVERALGLPPDQLTYIGDNPRKDFVAPRRRGWYTIRIRRPTGEHSDREEPNDCPADAQIASFGELTW
jgi:putative hydrolase of the HAD superfamily